MRLVPLPLCSALAVLERRRQFRSVCHVVAEPERTHSSVDAPLSRKD